MFLCLEKIMWLIWKVEVFVIKYQDMKMCRDAQVSSSAFAASGLDGDFYFRVQNEQTINVVTGFQEY
jgi:hypothetical protein